MNLNELKYTEGSRTSKRRICRGIGLRTNIDSPETCCFQNNEKRTV